MNDSFDAHLLVKEFMQSQKDIEQLKARIIDLLHDKEYLTQRVSALETHSRIHFQNLGIISKKIDNLQSSSGDAKDSSFGATPSNKFPQEEEQADSKMQTNKPFFSASSNGNLPSCCKNAIDEYLEDYLNR